MSSSTTTQQPGSPKGPRSSSSSSSDASDTPYDMFNTVVATLESLACPVDPVATPCLLDATSSAFLTAILNQLFHWGVEIDNHNVFLSSLSGTTIGTNIYTILRNMNDEAELIGLRAKNDPAGNYAVPTPVRARFSQAIATLQGFLPLILRDVRVEAPPAVEEEKEESEDEEMEMEE